MKETKVESQLKYQGKILDLRVDQVLLPNGKHANREVVLHHGSVAIVAVTSKNEVILVKQYRYPVNDVLWEIPAGKLEKDENPDECARRELAEETGFGATNWLKISTFFSTPGFSDEIMYLYLAQELFAEKLESDDDEFIEIHKIPYTEAVDKIVKGEIRDAKTIAGVLLVEKIINGEVR